MRGPVAAAFLLVAGLFALPSASAAPCDLGSEDLGVCAGEDDYGFGDRTCEGDGAHHSTTSVSASAFGDELSVTGTDRCFNGGSGVEEDGETVTVAFHGHNLDAEAGYSRDDLGDGECKAYWSAEPKTGGSQGASFGIPYEACQALDVPWGTLLP